VSARLISILAVAVVVAAGLVVARWIVQPSPAALPAAGKASGSVATDEARRRHREEFFGGDTEQDIRGGQEMKPRW